MPAWLIVLTCLEAFALPLLGSLALASSKLTLGKSAQAAQNWFIGILVAVTLITCRTVITSDRCWLLHTATLSLMVVGALLLPDRQTLEDRRHGAAARIGL
jgi:hypothetical protein